MLKWWDRRRWCYSPVVRIGVEKPIQNRCDPRWYVHRGQRFQFFEWTSLNLCSKLRPHFWIYPKIHRPFFWLWIKLSKIVLTFKSSHSKVQISTLEPNPKKMFYNILERALWALASSSGGASCPGATRGQPRGLTLGVRGWFQGDLCRKSPNFIPSKYWLGSTLLNFSDQTRTGVFSVIWPLALGRSKIRLCIWSWQSFDRNYDFWHRYFSSFLCCLVSNLASNIEIVQILFHPSTD